MTREGGRSRTTWGVRCTGSNLPVQTVAHCEEQAFRYNEQVDSQQWHQIAARVFREYDIRGNAEHDLTDAFVYQLGHALGQFWRKHGARRVALGRDGRLHSLRIQQALLQGLALSEIEVIEVGAVPTPVLYFAVHHLHLDGGIQLTGSHNPKEDNGFKILLGTNALYGERLQAIRSWVSVDSLAPPPSNPPLAKTPYPVVPVYQAFVRSRISLGPRRPKVVLDGANGVGGPVLLELLQSLEFEVIPLYCEVDGRFPHHPPDPCVSENLQDLKTAVQQHQADVGLAIDGDADRLIAMDGQGRILWGDQLFLFLAKAILAEVPGATFLTEVKCSQVVWKGVEQAGGHVVMGRVGHSVMKDHMKRIGALLGGEFSGHLFFAHRYLGYDDALYAALRLLEWLSNSPLSLSAHYNALPVTYATPEIRIPVDEAEKDRLLEMIYQQALTWPQVQLLLTDGVRIQWPDGWALVRASNTQSMLSLRFEATTAIRLQAIRTQIEHLLRPFVQAF